MTTFTALLTSSCLRSRIRTASEVIRTRSMRSHLPSRDTSKLVVKQVLKKAGD